MRKLACIFFAVAGLTVGTLSPAKAVDLDTGNAPVELIIPTIAPIIFSDISRAGMDATLLLRATALVTNSWYDASAPYHPTAVGVYSRLGRQPEIAATVRNVNIASLYATYRVVNSLLPARYPEWRAMLESVGLDPDDDQENRVTAIGLGNLAGNAIVAFRERDGMNQLGDEGGVRYNPQPYADYTGYAPVNTADEIIDPARWQPRIFPLGNGQFAVQRFVTPQFGLTAAFSYVNPNRFNVPKPVDSNPRGPRGFRAYKALVDEVLEASANLTEQQKLKAELFDNKINSLGFSAVFAALSQGLDLIEFIQLDFLTNLAAFDAGIAVWNQKARWDAVRPFTAIRYVYGDAYVTAWGGPGQGTVNDLPASQWKEYLDVADHPEYPSGSAALCAAHAESARRFLGNDALNWAVPVPQGASRIEPGITPAQNTVLGPWATWTEFEEDCGLSRLWGGVHFMPAIEEGFILGRAVGKNAHRFLARHIEGKVSPRPPQLQR